MLEDKLGETATHLKRKLEVKKVSAREVIQCSNDNCFLGLDIDVALTGSPARCQIARYAQKTTINKNNKTPCILMPKNATKKVCKLLSAVPEPSECSHLELPM